MKLWLVVEAITIVDPVKLVAKVLLEPKLARMFVALWFVLTMPLAWLMIIGPTVNVQMVMRATLTIEKAVLKP